MKGEKDLREAIRQWNQEKIHAFLLQKDIKWIFNPPAGSHHGGIWECCIHTVCKVMKAILNEQRLDDEGQVTLMCKAEAIVNGWPLTKVSDDPRDPEALTPTTSCSYALDLPFLQVYSPNVTVTHDEDGDTLSTWLRYSRVDGCANISHHYNRGKNGVTLTGILQLVTSSCCSTKPCQEAHGLLDVS